MIYLDNAATTFPKPERVTDEVLHCITRYCGNPGRGSHQLALKSAEKIYECRELVSDFFGLDLPENVFFTQNTTDAINTVIKGALKKGDHIIISDMEHNSVFRPIYKLARERKIDFDIFPTHPAENIVNAATRLIRKNTRMLFCTHCPNISSAALPIEELGSLCRRKGILFAVDAAQSAGHLPINMTSMNIDALCIPSHKGLYGIQGGGAVCLAENIVLDTLTEGGNGVNSLDGAMPLFSPERYEAGTPSTPAIVSMLEGIKEIKSLGLSKIHDDERALYSYAKNSLLRFDRVKIYESDSPGAVLLFNVGNISSDAVASELGKLGICVRGGYHCSALGHKALKTPTGGAVRISFGIFNRTEDIDTLCEGIGYIAKRFTE